MSASLLTSTYQDSSGQVVIAATCSGDGSATAVVLTLAANQRFVLNNVVHSRQSQDTTDPLGIGISSGLAPNQNFGPTFQNQCDIGGAGPLWLSSIGPCDISLLAATSATSSLATSFVGEIIDVRGTDSVVNTP